jgi:3-hydroxyacyl-[acyl-carrier-protein] dehydratase
MRLEYFQLIDRVTELSLTERTISASATVPTESTIFEGHFPGHPLMPGVLLIETMAQASGWLLIALTEFQRMPFLAQVNQAKLRSFVQPGAALDAHAELLHDGSGFAVTRARIAAGGKAVCNAELTFRTVPFDETPIKQAMLDVARRIELPQGSRADA